MRRMLKYVLYKTMFIQSNHPPSYYDVVIGYKNAEIFPVEIVNTPWGANDMYE